MRLRALLLLAPLALAARAQTDAPASADSTFEEVTVTAAREAVATREAPARVTVLDGAALRAAPDLAGLLQARAPAHVRRYGPSGLASLSIRGAGASQALVLLDGQPLADPALGQIDLTLLPTALFESVEVLSGPASGLYGSSALGGVVHLRPAADGLRATTEVGAWGERRVSGVAGGQSGALSAVAAVEAGQADGDYGVADLGRVGQPVVAREGWDRQSVTAYSALRDERGRTRGGVALWAADAERGLGGSTVNGVLVGARQWDRQLRLSGNAEHSARALRLEATGHVQRAELRYASPFPAGDRADAIDETGRTTTAALALRATADRGAGTWTAEATGALGRATHPSLAEAAEDRMLGVGLAGRQAIGGVVLFPALRADLHTPAGGETRLGLAPQLGANARLFPLVSLKASVARAFRMPTLNDRFWAPGGNPDLRPETAWSADLGAVVGDGRARVEATAFATTARDQIVWAPTEFGFWAPENVARTRTLGAEVSAHVARLVRLGRATAFLDGGAVGTVTDARDLDADAPVRYVPRWTAKAWGGLRVGGLDLGLDAQAVGARPTTRGGTQPLPAHLVVGARAAVARALGPAEVALGLDLDNLLDARYEVVRSYVMPPRHARLRLTVRAR